MLDVVGVVQDAVALLQGCEVLTQLPVHPALGVQRPLHPLALGALGVAVW